VWKSLEICGIGYLESRCTVLMRRRIGFFSIAISVAAISNGALIVGFFLQVFGLRNLGGQLFFVVLGGLVLLWVECVLISLAVIFFVAWRKGGLGNLRPPSRHGLIHALVCGNLTGLCMVLIVVPSIGVSNALIGEPDMVFMVLGFGLCMGIGLVLGVSAGLGVEC